MPRTRSRPCLPPLARLLRALLAVLALSILCALPAQAQEGPPVDGTAPPAGTPLEPQVAVTPADGGAVRTLPWARLTDALDLVRRTYDVPGAGSQDLTGIALGTLLEKMGFQKGSYSAVVATTAGGPEVQVSKTQIVAPGEVPAIVYLDPADGTLRLLRPGTAADPRGAELAVASDGVLALRLRAEARLTASAQTVEINTLVTFSASVPPGIDASRVVYEWDFNDDGAPTTTKVPQTSRSFKRAGRYNVVVNFLVDGRRYDADFPPSVEIAVTAAAAREDPTGDAKKANRRRDRDRDDGGGDTTPGGETAPQPPPSGGGGEGGGGQGGGSVAPLAPGPGSVPEPPAEPAPTPDPPPARRAAAPPPEPAVPTIDGYLLASADGQPLEAGVPIAAAADVRPAADPTGPLQIPALAWVLAGLLALVVLGWALESRTTLPYFKP